tara:strand:+ start:1606 stop:2412 length:807 start_codon:yes stop_codon:yes gene_type:complete
MAGTCLAVKSTALDLKILSVTFLSASLIQIGTNIANDYYDAIQGADTEERLGPERFTSTKKISKKIVKYSFILCFSFAFLFGLYLIVHGGLPILIIGVISILAGYFYTATRYSLAYLGLGDIFVIVFFGPVAVCGTYYLQTEQWSLSAFLIGLSIGFLADLLLIINNIRDIDTDAAAGKNTIIVRFGCKFGKRLFLGMIILALVSMLILVYLTSNLIYLIPIMFLITYIPLIKQVFNNSGAKLNKVLGKSAMLLGLFGVVMSISILIS